MKLEFHYINNPNILFGDEPTGALNKQSAIEVMNTLNDINEDGTTIILVTHDTKVASFASRVLYISDGRVCGEIQLNKEEVKYENKERILTEWLLKKGW